MKVLHLDRGQSMRGGQHQVLMLLQGLEARGHEQTLLAGEPLLERWDGRPLTIANLLQAAPAAEIIHAHDARAHTLAALFCPGKPLVVSRRVAFPLRRGWLSRWKYGCGRHYIAVSGYVRERLIDAGVQALDISVVYDGVRMPSAEEEKRREARVGGSTLVVAPAIADPLKGSELLRSACQLAGVRMLLATDLPTDLSRADVFVYLSESEGLGSATLLAMARRVPVIASRVGGIPEIVDHEKTGLLVANEVGDVAAAIQRMVEDRDFAKACTERAFRVVSEQFTNDIMVQRTEEVYRTVSRSMSSS